MSRIPGLRRAFQFPRRSARIVAADVDEELAFHLDLRAAELMAARGLDARAARAEALRQFGDLDDARRYLRAVDARTETAARRRDLVDTLWQDLGLALRRLRRAPGLAAAVVLTLALGLGANATMYGVVDRLLLSPPQHLADPDRLRLVSVATDDFDHQQHPRNLAYPDVHDLRRAPAVAASAAYGEPGEWTLGTGPGARKVRVQAAEAAFFPTLGVRPAAGRFYTAAEDAPGAPPTAVLSAEFWRRELGGDPRALGRVLALGKGRYQVVGVAPAGFPGAELAAVDVWVPLRTATALESKPDVLERRGAWWFRAVVRLRPGATDAAAGAQMTAAHAAGLRAYWEAGKRDLEPQRRRISPGSVIAGRGPDPSATARVALWLAGVSAAVLLIACANVANLLLARGIRARRELAVRVALGVTRRRLAGQLLVEAALLAGAGALVALAVAHWAGAVVRATLVPDVAFTDTGLGARLLGFTAAAAGVTALLAGALPAAQAARTAPGAVLRAGARGSSAGGARLRAALAAAQTVLSVVLLVGAGLFVRSLARAADADLGFDHAHTLVATIEQDAGAARGDGAATERAAERRARLYYDALPRVLRVPGVRRAALSSETVALGGWSTVGVRVPGRDSVPALPGGGPYLYSGTEDLFAALGVAVTRGRAFAPGDLAAGAEPVALVNETFVRTVWPGRDPLAQCVTLEWADPKDGPPQPCRRVVGVFRDVARAGLDDARALAVAVPPQPGTAFYRNTRAMVIRTDGDPAALAPAIRRAIQEVSPAVRYVQVTPMAERFGRLLGPWRLGAALFGAFGALALVVAAVGLYSALAFDVAERQRELGIRAALGARRRALVGMVLARAARVVGAGAALGTLLALAAGRLLADLLFGVTPADPLVYGAVLLALGAAGALAGLVPARRATRVDPRAAMQSE